MVYNDFSLQLSISLILTFLVVNFDFAVSAIFLFFAFLSLFFYLIDQFVNYKTEKSENRVMQLAYAGIAYLIFNVLASITLSLFEGIMSVSDSAFSVFNDSLFQFFAQNTPALTGNAFISLAVWGILIPIVETDLFFGRVFEFISDKLKINISFRSLKTWAIIGLVAGIFTIFHITAKGITNDSALLLTFIFGVMSMGMVVYFGQTIEAKIFHVIANSTALIIGTGLAVTNIAILGVLAIALFIHLYPVIKYQLRGRINLA